MRLKEKEITTIKWIVTLLPTIKKLTFHLVAVSMISLFFIEGYLLGKSNKNISLSSLVKSYVSEAKNSIKGKLSESEKLQIDIKQKDYEQIAEMRQKAFVKGGITPTEELYVSTTITFHGKKMAAKLKLKGDMLDHLQSDKWSFRIELKDNQAIMGMNKFSIQHPQMRNYLYEYIYHEIFNDNNILTTKYGFIDVTINGKKKGVYAIEEHFDKLFLEQKGYKSTPIVKFDENLFIDNFIIPSGNATHTYKFLSNHDSDYLSKNGIFYSLQGKGVEKDSSIRKLFLKTTNLLYGFTDDKLSVQQVFDIDKLAMFFAIQDLMSSQHSGECHNLRFHYNPYTSLIEPIGYDGEPLFERKTLFMRLVFQHESNDIAPFHEKIFSDTTFIRKYVKALEKVSSPNFMDGFLKKYKVAIDSSFGVLCKSYPTATNTLSPIFENQQYIRKLLHPTQAIHAFLNTLSKNEANISIANIQLFPVEIIGIFSENQLVLENQKLIIPIKKPDVPLSFENHVFKIKKGITADSLKQKKLSILYRILGSNQLIETLINLYPKQETKTFIENDFWLSAHEDIHKIDFLTVDDSKRIIEFKKGTHFLYKPLFIPKGYRVYCWGGTTIDLQKKALIVSKSAIHFSGTKEFPIIITSSDATGEGLTVIEAPQKSVLNYTSFGNLTNPNQKKWSLTSSVTFYKSEVMINNCSFANNHCEDALNIVHSNFKMSFTDFNNIHADAFDGDYVKGEIIKCNFSNCGNDAVDISGSYIKILGVDITNAGDKGISIGENSHAEAFNLIVKNSEIALASKDLSNLYVENGNVINCKLSCAVYNKKPEFGPARMEIVLSQIPRIFLVENQSTLLVDYNRQETAGLNVKKRLYGNEFGKMSE